MTHAVIIRKRENTTIHGFKHIEKGTDTTMCQSHSFNMVPVAGLEPAHHRWQ